MLKIKQKDWKDLNKKLSAFSQFPSEEEDLLVFIQSGNSLLVSYEGSVVSYNIIIPVEGSSEPFGLPLKDFLKISPKLKWGDVKIEVEGSSVILKCSSLKLTLSNEKVENKRALISARDFDVVLPKPFAENLKKFMTLGTSSFLKAYNDPLSIGILMKIAKKDKKKKLVCQTSDNFSGAICYLPLDKEVNLAEDILLPKQILDVTVGFLNSKDSKLFLKLSSKYVICKAENVVLKTLSLDKIQVRDVLSKVESLKKGKPSVDIEFNASKLLEFIDTVSSLATLGSSTNFAIPCEVKKDTIVSNVKSTKLEVYHKVKLNKVKKSGKFTILPGIISGILGAWKNSNLRLQLFGNIILLSGEDPDVQYVLPTATI